MGNLKRASPVTLMPDSKTVSVTVSLCFSPKKYDAASIAMTSKTTPPPYNNSGHKEDRDSGSRIH